MSKEIILAASISGIYAINESGVSIKKQLLKEALKVGAVSAEDRAFAVEAASQIKAHLKAVELSRKEVKDPFLKAGEAIDNLAKEHVKELNEQLNRINGAITKFDEAERRRIAEEARKQREEEARLERERAKAAREAQERAEAIAKQAREAEEAIKREASSEKERQALLAKQFKLEEEAAEAEEQAQQIAEAPIMVPRTVAAPVSIGQGGRTARVITILSVDLVKLREKYPHCVKLVPQDAAIKDLIKAGADMTGLVVFNDSQAFSAK